MTLEDYRLLCGWSRNQMARQAGVDAVTVGKALKGQLVSITTADKLARAISQRLSRPIPWQQIEDLKVKV